jgi:hypothetical protein
MKNIYDIYEGILSNTDDVLKDGDYHAEDLRVMHRLHPLMAMAGVSDNVEKLFTNKLDSFAQIGWYSERMEDTERKFGAGRWFYCRQFGKLLERLSIEELGMSLHVADMAAAEKLAVAIEDYVKKEGYLKKAKNIRIVGRYYDDRGNNFTKGQLQLEVQKVDKDGNVVKTKNGSVSIMYLFDCK